MIALLSFLVFLAVTVLLGLGYWLTGWRWMGAGAALPGTICGVLVALFDRARFGGVSPSGKALEFIGRDGGTIDEAPGTGASWGQATLYDSPPTPMLRLHEERHVEWWMRLGAAWPFVYVGLGVEAVARGGHFYSDNRMERDARRASGEETT